MSLKEAKKLAQTVTNEQLVQMFKNAEEKIQDWSIPTKLNPGLSLGTAYNIFTKGGFDRVIHNLAKRNMIAIFGDYLPDYHKPIKESYKYTGNVHHEEPNFIKDGSTGK